MSNLFSSEQSGEHLFNVIPRSCWQKKGEKLTSQAKINTLQMFAIKYLLTCRKRTLNRCDRTVAGLI